MLQKLPPNLAPSLAEAKGEAGVGETSIAVLLTADRLSAGLHLSEVMAKTFRSFKKAQKKNISPTRWLQPSHKIAQFLFTCNHRTGN